MLNPGYLEALKNKAETLDHLTKYQQAIECYDKILRIDPKNVIATPINIFLL